MTTVDDFFSNPKLFFSFDSASHPKARDETSPEFCNEEDNKRYYALLGVPTTASFSEIRQAYLDLSKRYHTDRHVNASEEEKEILRERFEELNTAYSVLSDVGERAAYDALGKKGTKMLSLIRTVPSWKDSPRDITDLVSSLDRANKVKQMARMLSTKSSLSLSYNWAAIGMNRRVGHHGTSMLPSSETQLKHDDVVKQDPKKPEETAETMKEGDEVEFTVNGGGSEGEAVSSISSFSGENLNSPQKSKVSLQLVQIQTKHSSEPMYVLIPDEATMKSIKAKLQDQGIDNVLEKPEEVQFLRQVLFPLMFPNSIKFQHSFQHVMNPMSSLVFTGSAWGSINVRSKNAVSFGVEYHRSLSEAKKWIVQWRTSLTKLFLAVEHLTPFKGWSLSQKLVLMDGMSLLESFRITLMGRIKEKFTIYQLVDLSLFRLPFLFFYIGTQGTSIDMRVGSQLLDVNFKILDIPILPSLAPPFRVRQSMQQDSKPTREDRNTFYQSRNEGASLGFFHSTPPCSISLSSKISPWTGQTGLSWKLLYSPSPFYRFGVKLSTSIPYSVSPFALPYFAVKSMSDIPQVSFLTLLYERGAHEISLPIAVFASETLWKNMLWLTAPLVLVRLGSLLYIPYMKEKGAKFCLEERAKHLPEVDMARQKALLEQQALYASVMESRKEEEEKDGLVILLATYGVLHPEYTTKRRYYYGNEGVEDEQGYSPVSDPGSPTINYFIEQPPILTRGMSRLTKWMYRLAFSPKRLWRWSRSGFKKGSKGWKGTASDPSKTSPAAFDTNHHPHSTAATTLNSFPESLSSTVEAGRHHNRHPREFPKSHRIRKPSFAASTSSRGREVVPPPLAVDTIAEKELLATTVPLSIDVTIALQLLVRNSALTLPAGTKAHLTGFYDPDPYTAEKKMLKIIYLYRNQRHVVVFNDEDEGILPQRSHQVSDSSGSDEG